MSVYVTDTHPLVWYAANEHSKLSKKVLQVFEKAWSNQALIYIPAAVLWEIALLTKAGQIRLPQPLDQWAAALNHRKGFDVAPLDVNIMHTSLTVKVNSDPFDEVIVATALKMDLPVITKDRDITASNIVQVVW